jgi:hypothetical protein
MFLTLIFSATKMSGLHPLVFTSGDFATKITGLRPLDVASLHVATKIAGLRPLDVPDFDFFSY